MENEPIAYLLANNQLSKEKLYRCIYRKRRIAAAEPVEAKAAMARQFGHKNLIINNQLITSSPHR